MVIHPMYLDEIPFQPVIMSFTAIHQEVRMFDIVAILLTALFCLFQWANSKRRRRLPLGPKGLPFLGNVHQIPLEGQHKRFAEWEKKFGDVVYARMFQQHIVILNSLAAARDLLEKRSSIYSDRPRFVWFNEVSNFTPITSLISSLDNRWRDHRRWFQPVLEMRKTLDSYGPLQRREVDVLLSELMQSPDKFLTHIKRFSGGVMFEVAYGHTVSTADDEYMNIADQTLEVVMGESAAASLVDFLPFLRYLPEWAPGGTFQKKAIEARRLSRKMLEDPFRDTHKAMLSGMAKPSFLTSLLDEATRDGYVPLEIQESMMGAAAMLYAGSAETSAVVLITLILAVTLHPEVLSKAQEEIDKVVGTDSLPELQDRDSLPYLECVLKEVYRWNPVVTLGVPHRVTQDDSYRDFLIPKGSTVISNIWAMSRDVSFYPDPEAFRPERFLDQDPETARLTDPRRYIFGFGRRLCPGRHLGDRNVWLAMANILATMDIRKARNDAGEEITPVIAFSQGTTSHPHPFTCEIRPRSEATLELVGRMTDAVVEN